MDEQHVPWAEIVARFGQLIMVRHEADRMVALPRYADRDDATMTTERRPGRSRAREARAPPGC
jgi:hypothetical protein